MFNIMYRTIIDEYKPKELISYPKHGTYSKLMKRFEARAKGSGIKGATWSPEMADLPAKNHLTHPNHYQNLGPSFKSHHYLYMISFCPRLISPMINFSLPTHAQMIGQ